MTAIRSRAINIRLDRIRAFIGLPLHIVSIPIPESALQDASQIASDGIVIATARDDTSSDDSDNDEKKSSLPSFRPPQPTIWYRPEVYRRLVLSLHRGDNSEPLPLTTPLSSLSSSITRIYVRRDDCGCALGQCPQWRDNEYGYLCAKVRAEWESVATSTLTTLTQ
jgi:hypothetical protein